MIIFCGLIFFSLKHINLIPALLTSLTILAAHPASAQSRFEVGPSYNMATAEFITSSHIVDYNTGDVKDSSVRENVKAKGGFGIVLGNSFVAAKLSDYSCLAIDVNFMFNSIFWESGGFSYSSNSQTGTTSSGSGTIGLSLPIGLSYKFGCDAAADKSKKLCMSVGAGLYPTISATVFREESNSGFEMRSYLKGEIGVFAGICMKLRGTMSFGKMNYINYTDDYDGSKYTTSLKGKTAFTLSLIFMPMSFKWGKQDWWGGRRHRY